MRKKKEYKKSAEGSVRLKWSWGPDNGVVMAVGGCGGGGERLSGLASLAVGLDSASRGLSSEPHCQSHNAPRTTRIRVQGQEMEQGPTRGEQGT